jgi:hypothetical protein
MSKRTLFVAGKVGGLTSCGPFDALFRPVEAFVIEQTVGESQEAVVRRDHSSIPLEGMTQFALLFDWLVRERMPSSLM